MIGNSFSICVLKQMPSVAQAMDLKLDLCSLYIGGRSLAHHCENVAKGRDPNYAPYEIGWNYCGVVNDPAAPVAKAVRKGNAKRLTKGATRGGGFGNIPQLLKADRWDVVTIQQASHFSWRPETYQPYADDLVATIRKLAPQAEIVIQETWSYTPFDKRLKEWKLTQDEMYGRLHAAYATLARSKGLRTIPMGTTVQLYRRALPVVPKADSLGGDPCGKLKFAADGKGGWTTTGDPFHLNREGEYLQGLVWTATLFGADVTRCAYRPAFLSEARAQKMRAVAVRAAREQAREEKRR